MLKKLTTSIILMFWAALYTHVNAQNCTIVSSDFVCVGDPISFSVSLSGGGTPTSYTWNLAGQSSSQANPGPTFNTPGSKRIQVVVGLPGGGTCQTEKTIMVHDPPEPDFEFTKTSTFCENGVVCIKDLTKLGTTGSPIDTIIIVWDDGNKCFLSSLGQSCCNTYVNPGTYTITMEARNVHGCSKKITKEVKIGFPFDLMYTADTVGMWCDSIRICYTNLNSTSFVKRPINQSEAAKVVWDFGDGEKDTLISNFKNVCHTYTKDGIFTHSLEVTSKDGCNQKYTMVIDTPFIRGNPICNKRVSDLDFPITKNKDSACWNNQVFAFSTKNYGCGLEYVWGMSSSSDTNSLFAKFSASSSGVIYPGRFGPSYIRLMIKRGDITCAVTQYDSVFVCGPRVNFNMRNQQQCKGLDTVYFCDVSEYFCVEELFRVWDFDDPGAPQCTTDIARGINVNKNCNYAVGVAPKHFYTDTGCFDPKLYLYDSVTQCWSFDSALVEIGRPDPSKLKFTNDLPCEGTKGEYVFYFDYDRPCFVPKVMINYDSACDPNDFYPFSAAHLYTSHCQEDDSVTVGFATEFGKERRYRSCDPLDYYTDPDNVCRDTSWYHDWFKLHKEPSIDLKEVIKSDSCIPLNVQMVLTDTMIDQARYIQYKWGDRDFITDTLPPGDSSVYPPNIVIDSFGEFSIVYRVLSEGGCFDEVSANISVGFSPYFTTHNPINFKADSAWLTYDSLFCVDELIRFRDSNRYFNKPMDDYWNTPFRPEEVLWDFGDGGGFMDLGTFPAHSYSAAGTYYVRMAAKDQYGCWDTVVRPVYISGVVAGIKKITQAYLCDDIVQFKDSSYIVNNLQGDSVVYWYWTYGDGSQPNFVKDPFHSFTSNGFFPIKHAVRTSFGCVDTVDYILEILGPKPRFDIVSDTVGCTPFTVEFKNNSTDVFEWIWRFGDPDSTILNTKADTNVTFTYTEPGWYNISILGTDSIFNPNTGGYKFCSADFPDTNKIPVEVRRILVLPIPPANFDMPDKVCVDEIFNVTDQSDTIYEVYKWYIPDLDDSLVSTQNQVSYSIGDTGTYLFEYTPRYEPILPYQRRCYDTTQKTVNVQSVKADFDLDIVRSDMPLYFFTNKSSNNAIEFEWDFGHLKSGGDNYSNDYNTSHDYQSDTGRYTVCLTVYNELGCWDSVCKDVINRYFVYVVIPNVFTPDNGDGFNDAFDIDIFGEELYDLKIYNRWGELVFHGTEDGYGNDGINWDGTTPGGKALPAGTYYFTFKYRLRGQTEDQEMSGVVTLIRNNK